MNRAGLGARGMRFKLLFQRFAFEHVRGLRVAISAARTHVHSATIQLHFQRVASPFGRIRRHVTQDVELILFTSDAFESGEEIVSVENREAARSFRQTGEDLLVGRRRRRKCRYNPSWPAVAARDGHRRRYCEPPRLSWTALPISSTRSSRHLIPSVPLLTCLCRWEER